MRTAMSKAECKREYSGIALICCHNADRVFSAVVRSTADKLVGRRVKQKEKDLSDMFWSNTACVCSDWITFAWVKVSAWSNFESMVWVPSFETATLTLEGVSSYLNLQIWRMGRHCGCPLVASSKASTWDRNTPHIQVPKANKAAPTWSKRSRRPPGSFSKRVTVLQGAVTASPLKSKSTTGSWSASSSLLGAVLDFASCCTCWKTAHKVCCVLSPMQLSSEPPRSMCAAFWSLASCWRALRSWTFCCLTCRACSMVPGSCTTSSSPSFASAAWLAIQFWTLCLAPLLPIVPAGRPLFRGGAGPVDAEDSGAWDWGDCGLARSACAQLSCSWPAGSSSGVIMPSSGVMTQTCHGRWKPGSSRQQIKKGRTQ